MGKRMTGGYSINMKSIDAKEGKINANIEFVSPGKNCITIQAITYPFLLISIPSSPSEVVWNISNRVEDCPQ